MSTATDMRDAYLAAEKAILRGQIFQWGERRLTRADLAAVVAEREKWERRCIAESRGGGVGITLANLSGHDCGREDSERWRR